MSIQAAIDAEPSFSMGRYTLEEAAQAIAEGTGESKELLEERIENAFAEHLIPVYAPGSKIDYQPTIIRDFYEVAYWNDLNQWLETYLPLLDFRFPKPPKLKNKITLRVEEIRIAARDHFDDPMSIPIGGKSTLRDKLCSNHPQLFTKSTFDQAWKVAGKENLVQMENKEQFINPK